MKKKEKPQGLSQFQIDLVRSSRTCWRSGEVWVAFGYTGIQKWRAPIGVEFRGEITKAIDSIDDAMRDLIKAENIMVMAAQGEAAKRIGDMLAKAEVMAERKSRPGEEPPSEKPSELNEGEGA